MQRISSFLAYMMSRHPASENPAWSVDTCLGGVLSSQQSQCNFLRRGKHKCLKQFTQNYVLFFFHCQSRSVSPFDIYDIIFQQTCDVHAFQPLALSEVQNICFITTPLLILWHITLMNKQWKIVIGTNPLNKYLVVIEAYTSTSGRSKKFLIST